MPLSANQIRDRAANDLGILPLGQSLASQDDARISQSYVEAYQYLKAKGLATWAFSGSVPDELVRFVVAMVAYPCLSVYGVSNDRYTRIVNDYNVAEDNIRRLVYLDNDSNTPPTDY